MREYFPSCASSEASHLGSEEALSWPAQSEPSLPSLSGPSGLYWACSGSLQGYQWCQEQTPPRPSQHCCQCTAHLQPSLEHYQWRHPDPVYSWLQFTKPSRLLQDTSAQPCHLCSLQNFQRFLLFHEQWTIPPSQASELKAKTTSYFILWQTNCHAL